MDDIETHLGNVLVISENLRMEQNAMRGESRVERGGRGVKCGGTTEESR